MYLVKKDITYSLEELCKLLNGTTTCKDSSIRIKGVAPIEDAENGYASFLDNPKYGKFLLTTKASVVLVTKGVKIPEGVTTAIIEVGHSYFALKELLELFYESTQPDFNTDVNSYKLGNNSNVSDRSFISKNVEIGENAVIYPGVFIASNVKIGKNVVLYANVYIGADTVIGDNVTVYSNTTIGSDGFGYVFVDGVWLKMPQVGNVVIEDNVDIGAGVTIDRAALRTTKVSKGCKIDNLVQIAHNVEIDENSVVASQSGISGSTKVGKNVTIAGQVGLAGHLKIGDGVFLGAKAGVSKDIPAKQSWTGYPARPFVDVRRGEAALGKLVQTQKDVKDILKRVEDLERN